MDHWNGIARLLGVLLRPVGFVGVGFFLMFVGVSWILPQDKEPALPQIPERDRLLTIEGLISSVSLPERDGRADAASAISIVVESAMDTPRRFNVPDSILTFVPYLHLRGKAVRLLVDSNATVYEASINDAAVVSYEEVVAQMEKRNAEAELSSNQHRNRGILLAGVGAIQFMTGLWWWRRRGYP